MYGVEKSLLRKRIEEVLKLVELSDKADVFVEK
jgi:ABC-type multidrug transport system ATPase subunit